MKIKILLDEDEDIIRWKIKWPNICNCLLANGFTSQ